MTYRELLTGACQQGMEAHEALTLLEHLFSLSRTSLLIHMDEDCDEQKISSFEQMAARRLAGYPLQYLLGEWEFFGLPFYVGEGVLIPRADTEVLVETALELCDGLFSPVICDLCSGTGCIPIALSKNLPSQASLTAVELSEQALSYLYRNKERHRCDNLTVVQADVLTWQSLGEPLRLNMAAFPRWVEYFTSEEDYAAAQRKKPPYENLVLAPGNIYEAGTWAMSDAFMADREHWPRRRGPEHPPLERDDVLLRGVVKDAKVGETYMGMEPMTKFLSVTVSTRFGDVELCHPFELVAEEQKDNVKPGAIVSTLCTLSGDAAIGEYAGGAVYSEEKALELLRYFFQRGGAQRLRGAMRSDGAVTFLANRQEGPDSALALLETVGQQLREADLLQCKPGTVTGVDKGGETPAPCLPGKRCLLLGDGLPGDHYAFLCLVDTDSLGRIREITITNDSRLDYEPDFPNTGEDIIHTRERLRHSMEVLEYWAVQDRKLVRDAEELWALEEVPLFRRRAEEALAAIPGDLEARLAAYEADPASDRGLRRVIHDIFQDLFCRAGGAEEDCWDVNGVFCNAPAYLLEGYDSHRKQLADELVLAQCLGLLSGRAEG